MSHPSTGRSSTPGNKTNDRLGLAARLVVLLQIFCSVLLHRPTNFTDDDNTYNGMSITSSASWKLRRLTFGLVILQEQLDAVDVFRAREWISTDADAQRLSQPDSCGLSDCLICQGT